MKITFLGAAGTVTGSSYVLTSGSGESILIDLGMFQGDEELDALNYLPIGFDLSQLSGAILTHAHLDHSGRLPLLLSQGFKGKIWMTPPTRDLAAVVLMDSAKIAEFDREEPLYDQALAEQTIEQFKMVGYHTPVTVGPFTFSFYDAGHMLGSASVEITDNKADSEYKKVIFSGDLGPIPAQLMPNREVLYGADVVVMESTYGDRLHPDLNPVEALQQEINAVEKEGGTLLIPAFALERTQEVLHQIMHLKKENKILTQTPIILDSPMAMKATRVYEHYKSLFNPHVKDDWQSGSPFEFPGIEIIRKKKESQALYERNEPKVIIAGSGMMVGGRIVGHAAHYLSDSSNRLFIVGYQGEGTLGRELLEGKRQVVIDDTSITVQASVNSTQAMSSHADQKQLLDWLLAIRNVKKVVLTHGDKEPRKILAQKISTEISKEVVLPELNQEITF